MINSTSNHHFDTMKQPNDIISSNGIRRLMISISCFTFILVLFTLASINEIRFGSTSFQQFGRCAFSQTPLFDSSSTQNLLINGTMNSTSSVEELRIFIGILTTPSRYFHRHILRLSYGTQSPENARVDVKFVFCNLTKEEDKVFVALEIMKYNDIIILNCKENMNDGKTYTYFSSLPEMLNDATGASPPYHYAMKTDDDSYFRLDSLVESLRPLSREDLYYGFVLPCRNMDPYKGVMTGSGYILSWDIVEWIKESEIPRNHIRGPEDKVVWQWLGWGSKGKNRYTAKWSLYDFPGTPSQCAHDFWPNTVAVHLLKTPERWMKTLTYFNATKNLKPSKLYHIHPL